MSELLDAASHGHTEVVKRLLDRGADINAKYDYGQTALFRAADNGHIEVVKLLLDRGAHIYAPYDDGWMLLLCAAYRGRTELVKLLLDRGADINAEDAVGTTPLDHAASPEVSAIIKAHGGSSSSSR